MIISIRPGGQHHTRTHGTHARTHTHTACPRPACRTTHSPTVGVWLVQSLLYPFVWMALHGTCDFWIGQQSRVVKKRYARYSRTYLALLVLTALKQRDVTLYLRSTRRDMQGTQCGQERMPKPRNHSPKTTQQRRHTTHHRHTREIPNLTKPSFGTTSP